jgi:hypothetical protein
MVICVILAPTVGRHQKYKTLYGKERIDWSYKPIREVLELWLNKSKTIEGANGFLLFDHLDIVVRPYITARAILA